MQALQTNDSNAFPYLVVDNFLPLEVAEGLSQQIQVEEAFENHSTGYKYSLYFNKDLLRFLFKFVHKTVGPQFGASYTFSDVYKLPQLYKVAGPWKGLAPHTDNQKGRDLAMIIYLSKGWKPEYSGELNLINPDGVGFAKVEPVFNRAAFFPLGPKSWHSVSPIKGDWVRTTLIQDWSLSPSAAEEQSRNEITL